MSYRRVMLILCGGGAALGALSYGHRDFRVAFHKFFWPSFVSGDWRLPLISVPALGVIGLLSGIMLGLAVAPRSYLESGPGRGWAGFAGGRSPLGVRVRAVLVGCLCGAFWLTFWSVALGP